MLWSAGLIVAGISIQAACSYCVLTDTVAHCSSLKSGYGMMGLLSPLEAVSLIHFCERFTDFVFDPNSPELEVGTPEDGGQALRLRGTRKAELQLW